jgi:hypothetical protein
MRWQISLAWDICIGRWGVWDTLEAMFTTGGHERHTWNVQGSFRHALRAAAAAAAAAGQQQQVSDMRKHS